MTTIYIDSDFKCYTTPASDRRAIETDAFDGKCKQFIEGYRFVPLNVSWTREDGVVFTGEMISPWRDYSILAELQALYEEEQAKATAEMAALVEEVYNMDMEVIDNV